MVQARATGLEEEYPPQRGEPQNKAPAAPRKTTTKLANIWIEPSPPISLHNSGKPVLSL